jgi:DNA-binding transcriptional LysR family regulator
METRRLQYFLQIVDAGSISRAASIIGIAQPALSQQLAVLESEMKVRLLDRSSSGVSPTEAGRRLYVRAQAVLRQIDSFKIEVAEAASAIAGIVAVGLPPTQGAGLGRKLLARVRREQPQLRVQIKEDGAAALVAGLHGGLLDLAICPERGADPVLQGAALFDEELFVMSSPTLRPQGEHPAALAALPWIVTSSSNAIRGQLQAFFAGAGFEPTIAAEVDSLPMVIEAVRAGLGVTLLPSSPVETLLASGDIVATPLGRPRPQRTMYLYQRADLAATPAQLAVRNMILDIAAGSV